MDNIIELAMQIILCLLIAAIIGGIIGYLIGKMSKCDKDDYGYEPNLKNELDDYSQALTDNNNEALDEKLLGGITKSETTNIAGVGAAAGQFTKESEEKVNLVFERDDTPPAIGQEIGIRPQALKEPLNGEADDLKEISGVGLKIEDTLQTLGIYNFQQIAQWTPDNVDWIENYLTFKGRIKKEDWIGQAKLLAAGGHTEFSKKVRRGDNQNY